MDDTISVATSIDLLRASEGIHLAILGVDSHLDVGATALDTHLSDDGDSGIPQALVLPVRQGLGRGNCDGVSRVHAHGVDILDGADDDHIVRQVTHDLQLELLPANQ